MIRTAPRAPSLCVLLLLVAGCGDDTSETTDAGRCWSTEATTAAGRALLGDGAEPFDDLDESDDLEVEMGIQGGFHITVSARIEGLDGGDTMELRSDENPRTLFSVYDRDGTRISLATCPTRLPYVPTDGDLLELVRTYQIVLDTPDALRIFGQQVTIRMEVVDSEGRYAADEQTISVHAPPGYGPDAGVGDGGLGDAGAGDAGAGDAGTGDAGAGDAGDR